MSGRYWPSRLARVVVAVADGDALGDAEPRGLAEPAARRVDAWRRARGERAVGDRVAVAEAEAGLAVAHAATRSRRAAQLVALEAEQVPVPVVGRDDVAQPADAAHDLLGPPRRAIAWSATIVSVPRSGRWPEMISGPVADVARRPSGTRARTSAFGASRSTRHDQLGGRLLVEVRQQRDALGGVAGEGVRAEPQDDGCEESGKEADEHAAERMVDRVPIRGPRRTLRT